MPRSSARWTTSCSTRCGSETLLFVGRGDPRGPEHSRFHRRPLHVRERSAGALLRHHGRRRRAVPARRARRRAAQRHRDAGVDPERFRRTRRARRRCCAANGCSTTCSARRRRRRPTTFRRWRRRISARRPRCVSGSSSTAPIRAARPATTRWIRSASASRTTTRPARGATKDGNFDIDSSRHAARRPIVYRREGPEADSARAIGALFAQELHREAADVRARPRTRAVDRAGRRSDQPRRRRATTTGSSPLVTSDREQPAVSDAVAESRRDCSDETAFSSNGACAAWAPRSRLPFLDAMYPAFAAQAVKKSLAANRMAFLYVPNGIVMEEWTPAGRARLDAARRAAAHLERARAVPQRHLMMLSGLTSDGGRAHGDGPRRSRPRRRRVSDGRPSEEDLRQGHQDRHLDGSDCGAAASKGRRGSRRSSSAAKKAFRAATATTATAARTATAFRGAPRTRRILRRSGRAPCSSGCSASADDEKDPASRQRLRSYRKSILDLVLDDAQQPEDHAGRRRSAQARRIPVRRFAISKSGFRAPSAATTSTRARRRAVSEHPDRFRRALATHDRSAGAGVSDRHDARHHGAAGHRAEPAQLSGDRHHRRASRPDASPGRQGEDREGRRRSTSTTSSSSPICSTS